MGYSNYKKIKTVSKKFHIPVRLVNLFTEVSPVAASDWLQETLRRATTMPLTNEKSKAERVVSPILLEISQSYADRLCLFSGEALNVKAEDDLSGECDFFFALHPPQPFIDAPIISLVESKDEDMEWGIAQCAAQMYGAKCYNEIEGNEIDVIYGCATDGIEWQFLKLENNTFYIDNKIFTDLTQIMGVWHQVIQSYL